MKNVKKKAALKPVKKKRKPEAPEVQKKRAEQRKKRYRTDAMYRTAAIEASRRSYRDAHEVETMDCRKNLKNLKKFGVPRYVLLPNNKKVMMLSFNMKELAKALGGYNPQVLYRWIYDGRLLDAALRVVFPDAAPPAHEIRVYGEAEVAAIIPLLGEHQQSTRHYRTTHIEFKARLTAAMKQARETWK